uniref:Uncharacterized protein n=1 Tax=Anguilla anguilla TaxID=7936 RepID=A0A0E9RGN9_ANGAN
MTLIEDVLFLRACSIVPISYTFLVKY